MPSRFLTLSLALFFSACASYETVDVKLVDVGPIRFVTLDQTIKFNDQIYSKGDAFELTKVNDGSQMVILTNQTDNSVAVGGGMGGPVAAVPVPTKFIYGIFVDDNLCATEDYYAAMDDLIFGKAFDTSHRIVTKGLPENIIWEPTKFCFSPEG